MAQETVPEFRPYVPSDQEIPEFTAKAVILGVIFGIIFGAAPVYLALRPPEPRPSPVASACDDDAGGAALVGIAPVQWVAQALAVVRQFKVIENWPYGHDAGWVDV